MRIKSKIWKWRHWLRRRRHNSYFEKYQKASLIGGTISLTCVATKV